MLCTYTHSCACTDRFLPPTHPSSLPPTFLSPYSHLCMPACVLQGARLKRLHTLTPKAKFSPNFSPYAITAPDAITSAFTIIILVQSTLTPYTSIQTPYAMKKFLSFAQGCEAQAAALAAGADWDQVLLFPPPFPLCLPLSPCVHGSSGAPSPP